MIVSASRAKAPSSSPIATRTAIAISPPEVMTSARPSLAAISCSTSLDARLELVEAFGRALDLAVLPGGEDQRQVVDELVATGGHRDAELRVHPGGEVEIGHLVQAGIDLDSGEPGGVHRLAGFAMADEGAGIDPVEPLAACRPSSRRARPTAA